MKSVKPHLAIFIANLLYGANYTIAKFVMPEYIKPYAFIFLRVSGALLFFLFFQLFVPKEKIDKSDYFRLFLSGIFGVGLNMLMFFKGLSITYPINASLIMITTPILVFALSTIVLKEKIAWYKILGLMLGLSGAFLIIGGKSFNFNTETAFGDLLILLNAISYSIYLTIVKPLMKKYKPLTVIKWVFTFGFIPVIFFSYGEMQEIVWSSFDMKIWWSLIFVVLGVTVASYMLNIYGLSKLNSSVVGVYIYLQPILALFFAWLFLGEINLTNEKIIAGSLIFIGVFLVSFGKKYFEK